MKIKKPFILLIIILIHINVLGQDKFQSEVIYGTDHAFSLTAPNGWVLDKKSGIKQGIHTVFYKKGETFENAETIMYVNTASFDNKEYSTLNDLIKFDLDNIKNKYSDLIITEGNDIIIRDNDIAKIRYLSGKSYGNYEAMAYIDAKKVGVIIVLTSRLKEEFENSLSAFEFLVNSYSFISDKVKVTNEKKD